MEDAQQEATRANAPIDIEEWLFRDLVIQPAELVVRPDRMIHPEPPNLDLWLLLLEQTPEPMRWLAMGLGAAVFGLLGVVYYAQQAAIERVERQSVQRIEHLEKALGARMTTINNHLIEIARNTQPHRHARTGTH